MGVTDSPGFCILPWIHLNLNPDGVATLCCQSFQPLRDENGQTLNAQTHALRDIWNSQALNDIRRRMASGERLPQCNACWSNEHFSGKSYRTTSRTRWLESNTDLKAAIERSPDRLTGDPLYMDIRLGNLCNLKCTVCKPLFSSQIERDPVHAKWNTDAPHSRIAGRFGDVEWSQSDEMLAEIVEISGSVEAIQLAGGEPTINRTLMAWLAHLCEDGRAHDIDLVITSNLTNARAEFLDLLPRFRSVRFTASIDGYGRTYEYVRFPAKWKMIEQNIAKLRAARPDADIAIACVLQAMNPTSLIDLIDWASGEELPLVFEIGRGLDHYNDMRILPRPYRWRLRDSLLACIERHGNRAIGELRANVVQVFDEMDTDDFSEDVRRKHAQGFMQFVNDMDASRGLSFRAIAPEIHEVIAAYCGKWDERRRYFGG